jgi:hypothetical protein
MGMSLLYQVHEPLPDAQTALVRARALVAELGTSTDDPYKPELGPVVTVEQFHHALGRFTWGVVLAPRRRPVPAGGATRVLDRGA